ncbi:putative L-aspartate dehydrogenase [Saccharospirillum salsuginis]|uniref:L-aspartate dehydrogenase n=2 Tax=Saccharospirillum salsuginis TaxID=418750 RepID=A0A918K350_9GAMM|nr:putative L-aspartate dehydrogenase [Saccharospirillum salsuginis]
MIGYGAMGREVHRLLPDGVTLDWLVLPEAAQSDTQAELGNTTRVLTAIDQCSGQPDLVVECAGHPGLAQHGEAVLQRGWTLAVVSVGALTDNALYQRLVDAARTGGGRLHILSGAVAGMDGLASAREGGLTAVTYEARKAPRSWKGSPAEDLIDLATVTEPTVFFEGSAGEAARRFPANANVAATVALSGLGMEKTQVKLWVDPHTERNSHRIHAVGRFGEFRVELNGRPLDNNPKTSMLAALSVVRACRQLLDPVVI